MSDVTIFAAGCVVTIITGIGFIMFLYTTFRNQYVEANQIEAERYPTGRRDVEAAQRLERLGEHRA